MIQVYMGDGKGKTTAALGLLLRVCGTGCKALYCQFLKSNSSSELNALGLFGERVTMISAEPVIGFLETLPDDERELVIKQQRGLFERACRQIASREYAVAVLDELLWAYSFGIISERDIRTLFNVVPKNTELVITGRDAPGFIIKAADYVSEIKKIKHPFDKNISAREGIEY